MKRHILHLAVLLLAYLWQPAAVFAQVDQNDFQIELLKKAHDDYTSFFKLPTTTSEFWEAIDFELNQGKFELAGYFLKKLAEMEPKAKIDEELIQIQKAVGPQAFQRLLKVQQWSTNAVFDKECRANADAVVKRIGDNLERALSDPERIRKYIALLDAPTKAERDDAFRQLMRHTDRLLPALIDTINNNAGKPLRERAIEVLVRMDKEFVAPLYEILKAVDDEDAKDTNLRLAVLQVFRNRADLGCIPYLWHMSSSRKYPPEVRDAARSALAYLREEDAERLPPAKIMLTQMADKCFHHQLKVDLAGKRIWLWDGRNLEKAPDYMPRRKAEYFFGMRYVKEAMELDPNYKPAQTVFLNFVLERTFDQELDKYFFKPMPEDLRQLLLGLDPDYLSQQLLNQAFQENNVPILLPLIDILGTRGEVRAVQPTLANPPRPLVRGLYYPDRRVQFAAVNAVLKVQYSGPPADPMRIVEILRRFVASEAVSRTLVAMTPKEDLLKTRDTFKLGGFVDVETNCSTIEETFVKLRRSADYDVIFVHPAVKPAELPFVVAQLRGDDDQGRLPLIVLTQKENLAKYQKLFERYPNTWVELDTFFLMPEGLKRLADDRIDQAGGGYKAKVGGCRLSLEERVRFNRESMKFLWQMGKGEIPGYNVIHAQDTLRAAVHRPELARLALETAAINPDRDTQIWLANVFFDRAFDKLKLTAITELRRHVLKNGLLLEKHHIANLKDAQKTSDDPEVINQLTLILANLRFSPQQQGKKLNEFNPPVRP